jgi:hypothetical protein
MTKRLEEAVKRLTPQQVEQLTNYAESLSTTPAPSDAREPLNLSWVGAMRDAPERDGVEAADRANEIRIELLDESGGP